MSLKRISLFFLFIIVITYFNRTAMLAGHYGLSDFWKFYESLLFHFSGQNLYSPLINVLHGEVYLPNANLNSPALILLLWPLHYFNYSEAYQIWAVISIGCMVTAAFFAVRPFPQFHKNTLPVVMAYLLYFPQVTVLALGEITSLLGVMLVAAWLFARKNKDISAGVCIGLLCSLKLFFGLFLIYFLCLKRFRVVSVALMTILIACLISIFIFGFQAYLSYHTALKSIYWYTMSGNASFYGFFMRLFSSVEGNMPLIQAPILANVLTVLCSIIVIIYLLRLWIRLGGQRFDLGFSLVIVSMLLLSPLGWVYYFPFLLIPYLVLVAEGNTWTHLVAGFLVLLSTQTGGFVLPTDIQTTTQVLVLGGIGFYVLLGFFGLLCVVGSGVQRSQVMISERLWWLIYSVIFSPSLMALVAIMGEVHMFSH